jgi:hypothetical protein
LRRKCRKNRGVANQAHGTGRNGRLRPQPGCAPMLVASLVGSWSNPRCTRIIRPIDMRLVSACFLPKLTFPEKTHESQGRVLSPLSVRTKRFRVMAVLNGPVFPISMKGMRRPAGDVIGFCRHQNRQLSMAS